MRPHADEILLLEDEPLLRNVICEALEQAFPSVRVRPAASVAEAVHTLEHECVTQLVSEVLVSGSNVSAWLAGLLAAHRYLGLVTFSTSRPSLGREYLESPRVEHIFKAPGNLGALVEACRRLMF